MYDADKELSNIRILVVEDDPHTQILVKRMLLDLGVEHIFAASSGEEALRTMGNIETQDTVNLVMCDWKMPKMNGIEVLKKIRASDENLPFLMVTGVADVDSVIEAKACSITGYIKKPFSMEMLRKKLRVVQRLLEVRKIA